MSLSAITPLTSTTTTQQSATTVGEAIQRTFTQLYSHSNQSYQQVATMAAGNSTQDLIGIQEITGDYAITMNLASTLARKALTAVETVIKAQ